MYYSKREKRQHSEKILDQSKTEIQQGKHQILQHHVQYQRTYMALSLLLCCLQHACLSWVDSPACMQLSLAGTPQVWCLQHHGVSTTTQLHFYTFTQWLLRDFTQSFPATSCLVSASVLDCREGIYHLFTLGSLMCLKLVPHGGQHKPAGVGSPLNHVNSSFCFSFQEQEILRPFPFVYQKLSQMGSCREDTLPFAPRQIRPLFNDTNLLNKLQAFPAHMSQL